MRTPTDRMCKTTGKNSQCCSLNHSLLKPTINPNSQQCYEKKIKKDFDRLFNAEPEMISKERMTKILEKMLFIKAENNKKSKQELDLIDEMWKMLAKNEEEIRKSDLMSVLFSLMDCQIVDTGITTKECSPSSKSETKLEPVQSTRDIQKKFALFKTQRLNAMKPLRYLNNSLIEYDGKEGFCSARNSMLGSYIEPYSFSPNISEINAKYAEKARQKILSARTSMDENLNFEQVSTKNFPDFLLYTKKVSSE